MWNYFRVHSCGLHYLRWNHDQHRRIQHYVKRSYVKSARQGKYNKSLPPRGPYIDVARIPILAQFHPSRVQLSYGRFSVRRRRNQNGGLHESRHLVLRDGSMVVRPPWRSVLSNDRHESHVPGNCELDKPFGS